jgi:predicted nucleic acid-binding protein
LSRSLVVDASVALKWVVTEPGSEEAASLLDEMAAGAVALLAPEHLVGEVANGLRKRVAQHVLTAEDACAALEAIAHLELTFVGGVGRWFPCLPAALEWGVTVYDALYVQLAKDFDAVLVTADERLHAAVAGLPVRLPVRLLRR